MFLLRTLSSQGERDHRYYQDNSEDLSKRMQRDFWKQPTTARKYMKLMEILVPGSVESSMVRGVTEEK